MGEAVGVGAGAAALALLVWLRWRVPDPARYETATPDQLQAVTTGAGEWSAALPGVFWVYCGFAATTMIGFATFGLLSFHMVTRGIVPVAAVPLIYAAAMAADAVAALASGWVYDKVGAKTLAVLPVLSALVPLLAFTEHLSLVMAGALGWGAALGVQESTLRAVVADLVAPPRRATAYGVFAAGLGLATAAGGALTGLLYDTSIPALIATVVVIQAAALVAVIGFRRRRRAAAAPSRAGR